MGRRADLNGYAGGGALVEPTSVRIILAASVPGIFAAMPAFLVGATGVLLQRDLGFSPAGLGICVGTFFATTSLGAVLTGRLVDRIGAARGLRLVLTGSGTALVGLAILASDFVSLVIILAFAGAVNSMYQPASNLALARGIHHRQGLTFGIKQATIPLATLVAGASIPVVALQLGWRAAFGVAGLLAYSVTLVVPTQIGGVGSLGGSRNDHHTDAATSPLVWLAVAAGCGTAGATSMATFLVETATAYGMSISGAGWLMAAGSASGIAGRLLAGGFADRKGGRPLRTVSAMLMIGAMGYLLLSLGDALLLVVGTLLGYAFGWGWSGLLMFAVVRLNPYAPASASGIIAMGAAAGAAVGPPVFGAIVNRWSLTSAWQIAALMTVCSAALVLVSRRRIAYTELRE